MLSIDDTVIDKPYSKHIHLVGHFWSGKHHKAVQELNLITLYYTDMLGNSLPVNYRLYDHSDNKTKNDYFLNMLDEVLNWGLTPAYVAGDSWYSPTKNLKSIRYRGLGFMFAIKSNHIVSITKGKWQQVQTLPEDSFSHQPVWLKNFGFVRVFRTHLKDQMRHYVLFDPNDVNHNDDGFYITKFSNLHDIHWEIEQFHRTLKQLCSVEKFQVRRKRLIMNHVFASLLGFVYLSTMIKSMYHWHFELFRPVVANICFLVDSQWSHLKPKYKFALS